MRPVADFAAGHIPGAVSIPLRDQFATWLGWLLPDDTPIVFVAAPGQDLAEITWQALKVGYERLAGRLDGGMAAWTADGGQQQTIELLTADRIAGRPVLDVRQRAEHTAGHIADAVHVELGDLAARTDEAPDGAVVHCGHGERAMTAASLLQRAGHHGLSVLDGGPADWAKATGRTLQESV
ncbi:rhodanese-like domain-containing protein [Streptomyces sp. 8N616]|uniref:rhodanese-like domain-containing protein n=1 Tax=Streptomyces sp. 8N616 TaxID=3457414 RepID=UPI003FD0AE56